MSRTVPSIKKEMAAAGDPERARILAGFFKTGKGQYGEGDVFLGITVPAIRRIALRYREMPLAGIGKLLESRIHEHRSAALEILVSQYETGDAAAKQQIFDFYLDHTARINNWDLVDSSASYIVGEHLLSKPSRILYRLARSESLWERRIATVATLAFIRKGDLEHTFAIASLLLKDQHDLIQKAVGWMLREAGKQSSSALLRFLKKNYFQISRTSLRYAIERFPEPQRKQLLKGMFRTVLPF